MSKKTYQNHLMSYLVGRTSCSLRNKSQVGTRGSSFRHSSVLILFALLSLVALAISSEREALVVINFPGVSEPRASDSVLLEDVAEINGPNDLSSQLRSARISIALEPSEEKTLTGLEVQRAVRKSIESKLGSQSRWTIQVPESVKWKGQTDRVPELRVRNLLSRELEALCPTCKLESVRLGQHRLIGFPSDQDLSITVSSKSFQEQVLIEVRPEVAANKVSQFLTATVNVRKEVAVLQRSVSAGEKITEADVRTVSQEIRSALELPLSTEQVLGRELRQTLPAFSTVSPAQLRKSYLIQRGQNVKVEIVRGDFELSQNLVAEEAGAVGDLIKVRSSDSKKPMSGRVLESGTVRLE